VDDPLALTHSEREPCRGVRMPPDLPAIIVAPTDAEMTIL
jgi:hypothetical protein